MTAWTAGYAADIEYQTSFIREQSPSWLYLTCLINGFEPPPLDGAFTYCELGCGQGQTLNILAAANPRGRFYGIDFMPAHIVGARTLATQAGLDNIEFLENSFEELVTEPFPDLPQFDFVTLHGVYSWVSPANRAFLVRFLARRLKPGGIAYVSYNSMPAWAPGLPLQRLLIERAALTPGRRDQQILQGIALIRDLAEVKAGFLENNPFLNRLIKNKDTSDVGYLVHEYLNEHWQPLYPNDVARDLSDAKLDFVGSADVLTAFPELTLTAEQRALLNRLDAPQIREMVRDLMAPRTFRKDVFIRGARRLPADRQHWALRDMPLALVMPRGQINLMIRVPTGNASLNANVYEPILDALAERPRRVGELLELPALHEVSKAAPAEIAGMLCGLERTMPAAADPDPGTLDRVRRLNRAIIQQAPYTRHHQRTGLAAAGIGSGVYTNVIDSMACLALASGVPADPEALAPIVFQPLAERGEKLVHDGKPIIDEAESRKVLIELMEDFLKDKVPLYRQIGVM